MNDIIKHALRWIITTISCVHAVVSEAKIEVQKNQESMLRLRDDGQIIIFRNKVFNGHMLLLLLRERMDYLPKRKEIYVCRGDPESRGTYKLREMNRDFFFFFLFFQK